MNLQCKRRTLKLNNGQIRVGENLILELEMKQVQLKDSLMFTGKEISFMAKI
jgi:hypothetical protein